MNTTYQINETARKRIESVRRKYRQGTLPLDGYLNSVMRAIILRTHAFDKQLTTDDQAKAEIIATAMTRGKNVS